MTWHPGDESDLATLVEVTFSQAPDGRTHVDLLHTGWAVHGAEAAARAAELSAGMDGSARGAREGRLSAAGQQPLSWIGLPPDGQPSSVLHRVILPPRQDRSAVAQPGAAVQVRDPPDAEQLHRPDRLLAEQLAGARDPALATGHQPVQVGASDEHGPGADRDRGDHVGAAEDPAVDVDLGAIADGGRDRRQLLERRRRAVELAAAVVRDDDRVGAGVDDRAARRRPSGCP